MDMHEQLNSVMQQMECCAALSLTWQLPLPSMDIQSFQASPCSPLINKTWICSPFSLDIQSFQALTAAHDHAVLLLESHIQAAMCVA